MVWLTGLARVLARSGYPVVEVPGWQGRGYGGRAMSGVRGVVCHHTATPWTRGGDYPSLSIVRDGRARLPGPLAQLGLGRSGTWYVIAAGLANHAGRVLPSLAGTHSNPWAIGIEAEAAGTGDPRDWSEVQMDSYARGVRALIDAYRLPLSAVLGHKEVCDPRGRKSDPSFNMAAFRARVAAVGTSVPPEPTPEEDVVTIEDRRAIAQEAANAVSSVLGPALARAEDEAVRARRAAERATAAADRATAALAAHDAAQAGRDEKAERVAADRFARRDRFNTRRYDRPGAESYTDLAAAGTYDDLSGAVIRLPTVG